MPSLLRRALVPVALLLVVPAAASAAAPQIVFSATAAKARGYGVSASAVGHVAFATLIRSRGTSVQDYEVQADKGVVYKAKANLSRATLKASLGKYGRLSLTFHATAPAHTGLLSPICKGKRPTIRNGTVTGTFKLRIDAHYFKTIRRTRMSGILSKSSGLIRCTGPALTALQPVYTLTTTARNSGSAVLTASRPAVAAVVTGTLTGTFTAKFDAGGRARFKTGTEATLSRPALPPK